MISLVRGHCVIVLGSIEGSPVQVSFLNVELWVTEELFWTLVKADFLALELGISEEQFWTPVVID